MQTGHKRKQQHELKPRTNKKSAETISNIKEEEPFPTHARPTPEECRAIRDSLLAFHGFPQEFAKYRKQRPYLITLQDKEESPHLINNCDGKNDNVVKVEEEEEEEEEESALDGLVKTVLSQNTTEVNSQRAFLNLKSAFPTWENVSSLNFLFVFVNLLVPFLFAVLTNLALSFACN
jgi:endonuclease-3